MSLTSYITYIFAADTSSTTGAGKTGLAYSDFTIKQEIPGSVLASLTPETIATLATYAAPTSAAHIRIKEVNSAAPTDGVYEVQIHDTNMAWANRELFLMFSATGARIKPMRIDLQTPTITKDSSGRVALSGTQAFNNTGDWTGTVSNVSDVDNPVDVSVAGAVAVRQEIDANSTKLDAAVSTRAVAGDAMTLTAAYDAAKTAATQTSVDAIPTNPLTTLGTNAPAGWINAAAIASNALDSKGNWNVGKTGYALTQTFPTNFSALSINASGHIVIADASLTTAKLGTFALAKTTNITGFNDIAATAIVSSGAITTLAGAVVNVTNVTGSIPAGATPPTVAEIDAQLSGTHGNGLWGGAAGSGAFTITQNVKTSLGANMQGVTVTMYDGSNYYTALTNASGNATFGLDAATYTQTAYYPGYTITNNGSVVVTANATLTGIVGTANSVTPPANPDDCTVYFIAESGGVVLPAATFTLRCTHAATGTGRGFIGDTRSATSDVNGAVSVSPAVPQTSEWDMRTPNGTTVHIIVPSTTTYLVPNFNA